MANIKSQIKRIGTNEKARQRNASAKSAVRTAIKKEKAAVSNEQKQAKLARVDEMLKSIAEGK